MVKANQTKSLVYSWANSWSALAVWAERNKSNDLEVSYLKSIQWHQWPLLELQNGEIALVYSLAWAAQLGNGHSRTYLLLRELSNGPSVRSENHKVGKNLRSFPLLVNLWSELFKTNGPSSYFNVLYWCLPLAKSLYPAHILFYDVKEIVISDSLDPFINLLKINGTSGLAKSIQVSVEKERQRMR